MERARAQVAPSIAARRIRHDYGRPGVVTPERWLAKELGRTPAGVHQLLYAPFRCGLPLSQLTALCIRSFTETGAEHRLSAWLVPIRSALAAVRTIPLSADLIREAQLVDLEEDMVEAEYMAVRSDANAKRWVAWIDRCIDYLLRLRASLVAEHKLED